MSNASSSNAKGGGSRSQGLTVPIEVRPRRTSAASTTSVASSTLGSSKAAAPPLPRKVDATIEKSKAAPRPSSTASARSAVSGTPERRKVPITTRTPLKHHAQPPPPSPVQIPVIDRTTKSAKSSGSLREPPIPDSAQRKSVTSLHTPHPSDASTIRAAPDLEHKPSSDTITKPGSAHSGASTVSGFVTPRASVAMSAQSYQTPSPTTSPPPPPPIQMQAMAPLQARGVTLNIGIPCMISSKRSRFKAFARYIGEVEGETGPWVGVEVPVGDGWSADKLDGRDWNDGSLRGVRYFDIGGSIDDGEERAARRQRLDLVPDSASSISSINGYQSSLNRRKREGELLHVEQERMKRLRSTSPAISDISSIESRGLFVRPQQILLVIDAQEQH
ncbi:hypothetical protein BS47DRAFT_1393786 [Hydnum rufescens UP504]|uniref:CAP-Gly domain-containing protein n=1 Tax=Hydnum rufescens UP504 TaxID=1448309 RepID=A0A9P6DT67_9AGAM|nr:hypothetical protein BS47DRAFT_1393786 [Hydnum rufescens UP504]